MTLDENDYLTYHLYTASKISSFKNTRIRSWVITTLTLVILAFLFFRSGNSFLATYFLLFAVLCLILFPVYSRWMYKKHYLKQVKEIYKHRFGVECYLSINDDNITEQDKTGEVRINTSQIEEINEISDYYFIQAKSGIAFVISKYKNDNIENIERAINSLIENKKIRHNIDLKWKWK